MAFSGFGTDALRFYDDLAGHNSREWWLTNRRRYEDEVRRPMEELLEDLSDEFGEAKLFRPNRDTRFSTDKTPYKTSIAASIMQRGGAALYVSLSAEGLHVGGGAYQLERDLLARYRTAVADDRSGGELEGIAAALRAAKAEVTSHTSLKTSPRGYPANHPRIRLLRQDGIIGMWAHPPRAWLHTAAAETKVADAWRTLAPLNDWLATHVG
jgi:uncharacterized protein (TIGR02453 family)